MHMLQWRGAGTLLTAASGGLRLLSRATRLALSSPLPPLPSIPPISPRRMRWSGGRRVCCVQTHMLPWDGMCYGRKGAGDVSEQVQWPKVRTLALPFLNCRPHCIVCSHRFYSSFEVATVFEMAKQDTSASSGVRISQPTSFFFYRAP